MAKVSTIADTTISIHALLAESDRRYTGRLFRAAQFLSTLSLRRATFKGCHAGAAAACISIHALLAESDPLATQIPNVPQRFLSTLSLRRATRPAATHCKAHQISIHALLAESDMPRLTSSDSFALFLSTLSLRRATALYTKFLLLMADFYPRSPCGERLAEFEPDTLRLLISIHALLAESDVSPAAAPSRLSTFLSTLSLRRATGCRSACAGS